MPAVAAAAAAATAVGLLWARSYLDSNQLVSCRQAWAYVLCCLCSGREDSCCCIACFLQASRVAPAHWCILPGMTWESAVCACPVCVSRVDPIITTHHCLLSACDRSQGRLGHCLLGTPDASAKVQCKHCGGGCGSSCRRSLCTIALSIKHCQR
ncbi:hypothetical protein COO60DRAFT_1498501 [Scenedesmus sp. NREL 46B-D3]|nr:hypothetical protein COO60DRAFT_1498501 [Scenedesmus sp. NREL 46B-D3]